MYLCDIRKQDDAEKNIEKIEKIIEKNKQLMGLKLLAVHNTNMFTMKLYFIKKL